MSEKAQQSGLAFNLFRDQAGEDLMELLKDVPGPRAITAPTYLTNYLQSLLDDRIMKECIKALVLFDNVTPSSGAASLIVVAPADRDTVDEVCAKFETIPNYKKTLLIIPRMTALVQQVIQNHNFEVVAKGDQLTNPSKQIIVKEFHADFVPVDLDFFLMPCSRTFYHAVIENDFNDLYSAARCLAKIQTVFGGIPQVMSIGPNAERVRDLMQGIMTQTGSSSSAVPQIDTLVIIDRYVDMVTPLMSPGTTEGLIDEFFGIDYGICSFPKSTYGDGFRVKLDENDVCFKQIRYKDFTASFDDVVKFRKEVDDVKKRLAERSDFNDWAAAKHMAERQKQVMDLYLNAGIYMSLIDDKLKEQQTYFATYNEEAELLLGQKASILNLAENYILVRNDWCNALRLICLEGAASVPHKNVDKIQKELAAEFGSKSLEPIRALEKLRLMSTSAVEKWAAVTDRLGCFSDGEPMKETCNGFIPVSVQLVNKATKGEWDGQWTKPFEERGIRTSSVGQPPEPIGSDEGRRVLVFFVGGVTLTEVAYIRQMGKEAFGDKVHYIIGATNKVNNHTFMAELCPGLFDN